MKNELYTWSKNGMKMIINTDFKKFNRQTNLIAKGCVASNTQYSNYITPYEETNLHGKIVEKGELQNYDLKFFTITDELRELIKSQNEGVMLYEFRFYENGEKQIIGHILIKGDKVLYKKLFKDWHYYYFKPLQIDKRQNVLDYCEKIILSK